MAEPGSTAFGRNLTLGVGLAMFGLAGVAAITHQGPIGIAIPVLIGGSALAAWARTRANHR